MIVLLIAIAVMSLAISFLCGYLVGARESDDILRFEGSVDAEAIKKWIYEQNNESGYADR